MRKFAVISVSALMVLLGTVGQATSATVTISDTQTQSNVFFGNHATSVLFDPLSGPISATGRVDISGFDTGSSGDNSVLFIGLIAKDRYDSFAAGDFTFFGDAKSPGEAFFAFLDTAWGAFQFTDSAGFLAALGQQTGFPGENLQTSMGIPGGVVSDFEVLFGATSFSITVGGNTISQNYVDTFWGPTDFTNGAYAFVGAFLDEQGASTSFDVTFSGPGTRVPEPGMLALLGTGLAGLGLMARRRRG